jgi:hypothetical protein
MTKSVVCLIFQLCRPQRFPPASRLRPSPLAAAAGVTPPKAHSPTGLARAAARPPPVACEVSIPSMMICILHTSALANGFKCVLEILLIFLFVCLLIFVLAVDILFANLFVWRVRTMWLLPKPWSCRLPRVMQRVSLLPPPRWPLPPHLFNNPWSPTRCTAGWTILKAWQVKSKAKCALCRRRRAPGHRPGWRHEAPPRLLLRRCSVLERSTSLREEGGDWSRARRGP